MVPHSSDHDLLIRIDENVSGIKKWMASHEIKDDENFVNVMSKVDSTNIKVNILYNWRGWMTGGIAAFGFVIILIVTLHK